MEKNKQKGISFKKRKENLTSSLNDIEKFLNNLNRSLKYANIFKHFK